MNEWSEGRRCHYFSTEQTDKVAVLFEAERWGPLRPFVHPASLAGGVAVFCLVPLTGGHAQTAAIDDLKGKIFDARMAQQTFSGGLKYCEDLKGKNFYYQLRNRILNLDEYFRSLENLVKAQVFNPQ